MGRVPHFLQVLDKFFERNLDTSYEMQYKTDSGNSRIFKSFTHALSFSPFIWKIGKILSFPIITILPTGFVAVRE